MSFAASCSGKPRVCRCKKLEFTLVWRYLGAVLERSLTGLEKLIERQSETPVTLIDVRDRGGGFVARQRRNTLMKK
ncbi:hypothetical protein [Burkholderia sp. THE68]|uniref:hypothetical protein n=1 Tax=Burkholderia sp. THE68 TaxID=758782 RepID=UPI001E581852|nr:hypothetical protein [Burkholderia sp. THE68]